MISFVVNFGSNGPITAWAGQHTVEEGTEKIITEWYMKVDVPDEKESTELYRSMWAGSDVFVRAKPSRCSSFEADEASTTQWEGRSLMLGNVRCRYPEAGPFMIPPKNLLLPIFQIRPSTKPSPSTVNIVINSNTVRIIGASPMSRLVTGAD